MGVAGPGGAEIADGVLELVADTQGLLALDEFRVGLLAALQRVVPSEFVSLNDVGPAPEDFRVIVRRSLGEELVRLLGSLAHENPLIERCRQTGDGRACRFSDVVSRDELRATAVYRVLRAARRRAPDRVHAPGRAGAVAGRRA